MVKLVGSSHGWLASFNIDNQHIFLSDPITNRHINLPDIHTLFIPRRHCRPIVDKIILTSSPAADDCRAVMTIGVCGMVLCRPGSTEWTVAGEGFYKDFVYSSRQKRLFCIASHETDEVESWDLTDPDSPTMDWRLKVDRVLDSVSELTKSEEEAEHTYKGVLWSIPRSLVFAELSDKLYVVTRYIWETRPYKTFGFDVHEIDSKQGRIVRYVDDCMGGLAMFVGNNHGFAVSAAEFPELKPDSIYFTDKEEFTPLPDNDRNYCGHDIGIFNYVEMNFSYAYYWCHASRIIRLRLRPQPVWFTSNPNPNLQPK